MTTDPHLDQRHRSSIDELCDEYVETYLALDPFAATAVGAEIGHDAVPDFSPEGIDAKAELLRDYANRIAGCTPTDDVDHVTQLAFSERAEAELALHNIGAMHGRLNVIDSPVQAMRDTFDLMPRRTEKHWLNIAERLRQYDTLSASYQDSLRHACSIGRVPARRQVQAVLEQLEALIVPHAGPIGMLINGARIDGRTVPAPLHNALSEGAEIAVMAFTTLHSMLSSEILPIAPEKDAVGEEEYVLWSRYFLGASIDLRETYEWGLAELRRIEEELRATANSIVPGGSLTEAMARLADDPTRVISDAEAFREWMQAIADEAVVALSGVHFDIPEQVRTLECRIAPTGPGGMYYTGPSEDFSRPGRMWWSVPNDQRHFATWAERSTVYHEGVPGHHLQVGQTMVRAAQLNRWRRTFCWVSGHGEGWALYAERLMADLGFLEDAGDYLGMLSWQAFRAMRVVADIGVHCEYEVPDELGGGTWDAEAMWRWIRNQTHGRLSDEQARFEHLRYLGWPGQAPSYKVGERLWLQLREEARIRQGANFDLRAFHREALDLGNLGLETLAQAMHLSTQE